MSIFDNPGLLGSDEYRRRIAQQSAGPSLGLFPVQTPRTFAPLLPVESSGQVPGVSAAPQGAVGGPTGPGPDQAPVDAGVSNKGFLEGMATFGPIALGMLGPTAALTIGKTIGKAVAGQNQGLEGMQGGIGGQGFGGADVSGGAVGNANDAGPGLDTSRGLEGMQSGFGSDQVGVGQVGDEVGFEGAGNAGEGTK